MIKKNLFKTVKILTTLTLISLGIIIDINLTHIIAPEPLAENTTILEPATPETPTEKTPMQSNFLNVNCILQTPDLPTGCEVTALAMILNYYGYDIDKCDLSDYYLDKGDIGYTNANDAFIGNPRYDGSYGCYAPVIVNCANNYLNGERQVINLTGTPFYDLLGQINNETPVIVWVTMYLSQSYYTTTWDLPDGEFTWKANEHCVVLTGYDFDNRLVYVADPLVGNTTYNMDTFADRYNQMLCQAIIIK